MVALPFILYAQMAPPKSVITAFEHQATAEHTDESVAVDMYSPAGQRRFFDTVVGAPLVAKFPPKQSYAQAVCKMFIANVEARNRERNAKLSEHPPCAAGDEEEEEEEEELLEELSLLYIELQQPSLAGMAMSGGGKGEDEFFYKSFLDGTWSGEGEPRWLTIKVAPNFSNVGLALWPSGFVLLWALLEQLKRLHQTEAPVKVLELGAGVGLTAAVVSAPTVGELFLTDYQELILDNCRDNVDFMLQERSAEEKAKVRVELMDWMEEEENVGKLKSWDCDLCVAADVVYDRTVIPGLGKTLEQFFASRKGADVDPVAVVVQTHRNPASMAEFHDTVSPFADVITVPASTLASISTENGDNEKAAPMLANCPVPEEVRHHLQAAGLSCVGPFLIEMLDIIEVHYLRPKSV